MAQKLRRKSFVQQSKMDNLRAIVKLVAASMPTGAEDRKLRAAIQWDLGASPRTTDEYLELLTDANKIEKGEDGIWRMVA
jgi:hypothetical protein